ncbi:unnamed protein product [Closterium sp. NIES-54]
MAEHIDVTTLTRDRLNELPRQLHESSEEIAALTAERTSLQNDVALAQQAQSQAPSTPTQPAPQASQHGSVGQPASAASDGVVRHDGDDDHGTTHPEATNAARSQPRVTISALTNDLALPPPMPLKPQRPPCFDPSQRGGPTVQAWLFTLNVFFYANYVSKDTAKIHYTVSLLRGPAMDWWCVIVTKLMDYATLPTREGQNGPWAPSYFVEVPQYCTWDAWCVGLRARFEPIAASIAARQKLRTWHQLDRLRIRCGGKSMFDQEMLATTLDRTDILLGRDWLRRHNPLIDWTTGDCTVRVNSNNIALPRWGSPESSSVRVNAITMKRVVAAGADVYAVDIREAEAADKGGDLHNLIADVPDDLATLLKQYIGIFPDDLPP